MWDCQNKPKKHVASHLEANGTCLNTLKSENFVFPKNPECPKSKPAEIRTGCIRILALSEIQMFVFQTFTVLLQFITSSLGDTQLYAGYDYKNFFLVLWSEFYRTILNFFQDLNQL